MGYLQSQQNFVRASANWRQDYRNSWDDFELSLIFIHFKRVWKSRPKMQSSVVIFMPKNADNSFVSKCSEKQVSVFFFVWNKRNCKNTEYNVIEFKAYCAMVVIMEINWDNNLTWLLVLLTLFEAKTRQIDKLGW